MFIRGVADGRDMNAIEGQVITAVRHLADEAPDGLVWTVDVDEASVALELGDGSLLIPASDIEGNQPGVFATKNVDAWEAIEGTRIQELAPMAPAAMAYRGWETTAGYRPPVLTLDSDAQLYPTADPEGNHRGVLFRVANGETFIVEFESADPE